MMRTTARQTFILSAMPLVATVLGCADSSMKEAPHSLNTPLSPYQEQPAVGRSTKVGGKYWTAHFFGNDADGAVMNFIDYGIIPVTLASDGTVSYGGRYRVWKDTWSLKDDTVTIKQKLGPWTLKVTQFGDVLVSDPPIEFGVPNNTVRLIRDDPSLHARYLGKYKRVSGPMRNVPAEIDLRDRDWSSSEPGYGKRPWVTAGSYVVLVGPEPADTLCDYESLVLRPSADGKRLIQDLSNRVADYGKDISVVYERLP